VEPKLTPEEVMLGVSDESFETLKTLDGSGKSIVVPKPGFEPGHPCGR
jgi:hypothetical protein